MIHIGRTKDGGAITIRKAWEGCHKLFLRGSFMGIIFDSQLESVVLHLINNENSRIYNQEEMT